MTTVVDGVELKDTLNAHWKQNKSSFGFRMLQKMGWSEEKGLGKNEDGMVNSVKVKRREEGLGLGMEAVKDDAVGSKSWNSTVSGFNAVLELLKNQYTNKSSSASDEDESDSEKPKKKKQKKEKKDKKEKKEKKPRPIISVGISYKKFRDAKTLEGKSEHDKKAIFGHAIPLSPSPASSSNTTVATNDEKDSKKKAKKEKKEKKDKDSSKKRKRNNSSDNE